MGVSKCSRFADECFAAADGLIIAQIRHAARRNFQRQESFYGFDLRARAHFISATSSRRYIGRASPPLYGQPVDATGRISVISYLARSFYAEVENKVTPRGATIAELESRWR